MFENRGVGVGFPLRFPLLTIFCVQLLVESLHPAGTVLPHLLGYMTVHIQCELCGCVAQICLYGLDVIACVEGCDSEAVAQIVEPGIIGEIGPLGDLLEVLDHRASDEIFSGGIGEHQIELVVPDTTGGGLRVLQFQKYFLRPGRGRKKCLQYGKNTFMISGNNKK